MLKNINSDINSDKKKINTGSCLSSAVLLLLLSVFLNTAVLAAHRSVLQQGIAEEVLRFHVLANSDSEEDQDVKYLVRDAVLSWMSEAMRETHSASEAGSPSEASNSSGKTVSAAVPASSEREMTLQFLSENLSAIEEIADGVLREQGMSYRASAEICSSYFPDRTYGDCTFPAGWYEALRIKLGAAEGQNWWCLLYPCLCFSDCLRAVVEEDGLLRLEEVLTVEEYESLLRSPRQWKISFRWF